MFNRSADLFNEAKALMPGGVNSPVRAFKSIGTHPIFIKKASGPYIWDEDDNKYIDYVGSWGPMILGHADPDVETAIINAVRQGTSYGAPSQIESEMAREVIKLVPGIEKVRMVNSGTEAVLSAIRLARAYASLNFSVEKNKIVKFVGCYHGHVDSLLVQAGSGVATLGLPDSPGVTKAATANTLLVNYNDPEDVSRVFEEYGEQIAALIVEPVAGNSGCILPKAGFLQFLRDICDKYQALLIFDEVMTGFRVALNCAQGLFKVTPDITCLGKVIGGGMPVGAYGASAKIMSLVAPEGPMYQAGTLSGNPVAMSAGLAALKKIQTAGFYEKLTQRAKKLLEGLRAASKKHPNSKIASLQVHHVGAMLGMFFLDQTVFSFNEAKLVDQKMFRTYYRAMLHEGVYLPPSSYEAWFLSDAHSDEDLEKTIAAHARAIKTIN